MLLDVYTIEIVPDLKARSTEWLTELGYMHTGRALCDNLCATPTVHCFLNQFFGCGVLWRGAIGSGRLHTRLGDGYLGWPTAAPFDAVVVTCSPDHVQYLCTPKILKARLES